MPIKKIKDESALNNFEEFTMITSAPITGFYGVSKHLDKVVQSLTNKYNKKVALILPQKKAR